MTSIKAKIGCVEIPVHDLDRAVKWYCDVFGYICTWSDDNHAMLAMADEADSVALLLVQTDDNMRLCFKSTHTNTVHSVLDFETDNLEAFHSWLKKFDQQLPSIPEPANKWAPRGFGFSDSEGNRLAVFCYSK